MHVLSWDFARRTYLFGNCSQELKWFVGRLEVLGMPPSLVGSICWNCKDIPIHFASFDGFCIFFWCNLARPRVFSKPMATRIPLGFYRGPKFKFAGIVVSSLAQLMVEISRSLSLGLKCLHLSKVQCPKDPHPCFQILLSVLSCCSLFFVCWYLFNLLKLWI